MVGERNIKSGAKNWESNIQQFFAPNSLIYQQKEVTPRIIHLTIEFNLVKFSNDRNKLIPHNQTRQSTTNY